ncbi:MAG TPA: gamma-glutamyl-gamma-aminobutyrate hydrolase family protein [Fimbriimonas sp.]
MAKPIIAITVDCHCDPEDQRTKGRLELNWNYAQAVSDAGGVPILIPPTADMEEVAAVIHGWLIPGGNDIDASRFGETNHPKVSLQDPARYDGEAALFGAIAPELPVLGICYGCQFINVVRGGSLIQHLPEVVGHESHTGGTLQRYEILAGSKLARHSRATEMVGKSYHHQAVARLGENLDVVAREADGTIEAIEARDRPYLIGLQWHPERTLEDAATQKVFRSFIEAARSYMENQCEDSSMVSSPI